MTNALSALRSYPLAFIMTLVLFALSLIIATSSAGKISGGGDDQGSGMGGTGKSGHFGDSGLGSSGGSSPFLGGAPVEFDDDAQEFNNEPDAPWMQREQETATIPEDMRPLIELQRNPLSDPTQRMQDDPLRTPGLNILDTEPDSSLRLPPRILEMAESDQLDMPAPVLEIHIEIPLSLPVPQISELVQTDLQPIPTLPRSESDTALQLPGLAELDNNDAAELATDSVITEIEVNEDRRKLPERIQRPELPPFQRMRPAVDRSTVSPPRVQPMRI